MTCVNRELVYPIFLECIEWAEDDPYWESIFENLAYGKSPHGTYISRGNLCCSNKKRSFSYKIENKDSSEVYKEVFALLSHKVGLVSDAERLKRMEECESVEKENSWAVVQKKKNTKELLIEQFVTRMRNQHSLNMKQGKELLSIINTALTLKSITQNDVLMENGAIYAINDIEFSDGDFEIKRDLYNVDVSMTGDTTTEKTPLSKIWHKYVDELRKSLVCRNKSD